MGGSGSFQAVSLQLFEEAAEALPPDDPHRQTPLTPPDSDPISDLILT